MRRSNLVIQAALTALGLVTGVAAADDAKIDLTAASQAGDAPSLRVRATLRLGGEVLALGDDSAAAAPVGATATIEFRQQALPVEAGAPGRQLRVYDSASLEVAGRATTLRLDRRRVVSQRDAAGHVVTAAVDGPLTRDELDLVEATPDPAALEGLLPHRPVGEGENWAIGQAAIAPLLGLDAATLAEVSGVLDGVTLAHAKLRFAGAAAGTIDGAEVDFDLRGVALFDRAAGRFVAMNLAFTERRRAGPATPATDVSAKLNVAIEPIDTPVATADEARRLAAASLTTALELRSPASAWTARHERGWHVVAEDATATTLRLVDGGATVGETTVTLLAPRSGERLPSVESLERDVRYAHGARLERVVTTDQWTTPEGLRCVALVATGRVGQTAVEWRHYLATPRIGGTTVAVATTVDAQLAGALGGADRALVNSLELAVDPRAAARDVAGAKR